MYYYNNGGTYLENVVPTSGSVSMSPANQQLLLGQFRHDTDMVLTFSLQKKSILMR